METIRDPILPTDFPSDKASADEVRQWRENVVAAIQDLHRDSYTDFRSSFEDVVKIEIEDDDYAMGNDEPYNTYMFTNLTADKDFDLIPIQNDRRIVIYNFSDYSVNVNPNGTDLINDWNYKFELTEFGGRLELVGIKDFGGLTDRWAATPSDGACILSAETETADTGLSLAGNWDDVSIDGGATDMTLLSGEYGKGWLSAQGCQVGYDSSNVASMNMLFGVGVTAGNNAPDIPGGYSYYNTNETVANTYVGTYINRLLLPFRYTSDGSAIYMKSKVTSNEMNITTHSMYGATNSPMGIYWRRVY